MRTIICLWVIICSLSFVSAQKPVQYEILQNDPLSYHKIVLFVSPMGWTVSNNIGLFYGLRAAYNYDNKFIAELDFRRSYTEKINAFFNDFADFKEYDSYCEPISPVKNLMTIELNGQYLLGSHLRNGRVRVVLHETGNTKYYIKVPAKRYFAFPVRLGYAYYQSVRHTSKFFVFEEAPYYGTSVKTPATDPEAIRGIANFFSHQINLGLGLYIRDNITLKITDYRPQFSGVKNLKESIYLYVDLMIPIKQEIENINFIEKSHGSNPVIKETEYNVNDYTAKSNYGLRTGLRYQMMEFNPLIGAIWLEFGFRPGSTDSKNNSFFICGLDIGIFKRPG